MQIGESSRRGTIRLIALGMYRRHTAFWAWSSEEWIEILSTKKSQTGESVFQQVYRGENECRGYAIALAYLLCDFKDLHRLGAYYRESLAHKLFGEEQVDIAVQQVLEVLKQWGYKELNTQKSLPNTVYETLLVNRHPSLEVVTRETLELVYHQTVPSHLRNSVILLSRVLVHLGIIAEPLTPTLTTDNRYGGKGAAEGVHEEWVSWCQRWRNTSTFAPNSREGTYYNLLKAGHWLAENHPEITSPAQWTRALTIEYVATVDRMVVGQWVPKQNFRSELAGKPLTPRSKSIYWARLVCSSEIVKSGYGFLVTLTPENASQLLALFGHSLVPILASSQMISGQSSCGQGLRSQKKTFLGLPITGTFMGR